MKSRWVIVLIALGVISFGTLLAMWVIFVDPTREQYIELVMGHFAAIVGLPMAAICSLLLVAILRQHSGEGIKFKGLGFEFTGPSGEVILWVVCFTVITIAIKAVW